MMKRYFGKVWLRSRAPFSKTISITLLFLSSCKEKDSEQQKFEKKSSKTIPKNKSTIKKTITKSEGSEKKEKDSEINILKTDTKEVVDEIKDIKNIKKVTKKAETKNKVTNKEKEGTDTIKSKKIPVETPLNAPKIKARVKTSETTSTKLASKTQTKKTSEKKELKIEPLNVANEKKGEKPEPEK